MCVPRDALTLAYLHPRRTAVSPTWENGVQASCVWSKLPQPGRGFLPYLLLHNKCPKRLSFKNNTLKEVRTGGLGLCLLLQRWGAHLGLQFLVLTHVAGKLVPMSVSCEFLGCTWGLQALPAAFLRAAPDSSHHGGALTGTGTL